MAHLATHDMVHIIFTNDSISKEQTHAEDELFLVATGSSKAQAVGCREEINQGMSTVTLSSRG